MLYIFAAFVFGFSVPYMARRFAKFMPATFAGALVELCRCEKKLKSYRKTNLYKKFVWRSVVLGLVTACITSVAYNHFGSFGFGFIATYIWLLILMAEIDFRTFLLPDILTIPLLLLGVFASCNDMGFVAINESVLGAVVGYFLPVAVSLLIVWRKKDAFGGGDIKLMSAIGAWLGVKGLLYVVVLSSILGIVYGIFNKKTSLAFGPMIAIAGIVIAVWMF